jgi:hypothetical protein
MEKTHRGDVVGLLPLEGNRDGRGGHEPSLRRDAGAPVRGALGV